MAKPSKLIKLSFMCLFLTLLIFLQPGFIYAQVDVQQLVDKISMLENRVKELEGKLSMPQHLGPEKATTPVPYEKPTTEGLVKTLEDIHLGGYVTTAYNLNTRSPLNTGVTAGNVSTDGGNTSVRLFDRDSNSFSHSAHLSMAKLAEEAGSAGFRTDFLFGREAQILNSYSLGDATDNVFVEEAYVQYVAPLGNGIKLKAGRFEGIEGAEATESKDNWNISTGILNNFNGATTYNGILGTYGINDKIDVKLGVANGWDNMVDNNKSKTLISGFALYPMDGLEFDNAFILGSEQSRTSESVDSDGNVIGRINREGNLRGLWNSVVYWTPIRGFDRWKTWLDFDYGWEEGAEGKIGSGNAIWHGSAFAMKYDINKWLSLAGRWEYFSDPNGVRTSGINGLTPTQKVNLYAMTYTLNFKIAKNLISRLEYRVDQADKYIFDLTNGLPDGAAQSQQTFGSELIYAF